MYRVRPLALALAALASSPALAQDAPKLYAQGYDALQEDRLDEAARLLSACVVEDPTYADCWWGLGWVDWKRGEWTRVVRLWEQVERISPGHPHVVRWLPKARERLAGDAAPEAARASATPQVAPAAPTVAQQVPHAAASTPAPSAAAPQVASAPAPPEQVASAAHAAPPQVTVSPGPAPKVVHPVYDDPSVADVAEPGPITGAPPEVRVHELADHGQRAPHTAVASATAPPPEAQAAPPQAHAPQGIPSTAPTAPPALGQAPATPAPQAAAAVGQAPQVAHGAAPTLSTAPPQPWQQAPGAASPTVAPTPAPAPAPQVADPAGGAAHPNTAVAKASDFQWNGRWHFGECWTTAAGFDACVDHAVRVFERDGALYAEYDADGYQTMTRYLCKVVAQGDHLALVHVQDREGNVFAGTPGEVVVTLERSGQVVEARLPGDAVERLLARRR